MDRKRWKSGEDGVGHLQVLDDDDDLIIFDLTAICFLNTLTVSGENTRHKMGFPGR